MSVYQIATEVTLETDECCVCHIIFAMPKDLLDRARISGGSWYCPNGHYQGFKETENMRLRHRLDQTEAQLETTQKELSGALQEVSYKKRTITRMKNRVQNGVCTECHRHFVNLERHMKTKHAKD